MNHYIIHLECACSVAQLCLTLCDPMDYSPPGSSFHGILQARILEWGAISYSRGSSRTQGSNPSLLHLLHWQVSSSPLCHQGSPTVCIPYCTLYDTVQQLYLKSIILKRDHSEEKISSTNSKNLKFSHYKRSLQAKGGQGGPSSDPSPLGQPWRLTQNRKSVGNGNPLVVQRLELRALNAVGWIPGVGIKTLRDTQRAPPQSLSRMTSAVPQHPPLRTGVPGAALPSFPPTSFALTFLVVTTLAEIQGLLSSPQRTKKKARAHLDNLNLCS